MSLISRIVCASVSLMQAGAVLLMVSMPATAGEPIRLQLRWYHQFQFAGYYMAKQQGYYQQAGLDVEIKAGAPGIVALDQVLNGNAEFAVSASGALLAYLEGKPVVAMAAIFQKSPNVWLVLANSDIYSLKDLSTRRLEMSVSQENTELLAVFASVGIDVSSLNLKNSSMQLDNVLSGNSDAFNAYLSNEPYQLEQLGVPYRLFKPADYGINFYQDVLITNADWLKQHPELAETFVQASLKGWRFALNNIDFSIRHIQQVYAPDKSLPHLRYEAGVIQQLVMPDTVELGHMSSERWQDIANTYLRMGKVTQLRPLASFIYTKPAETDFSLLIKSVLSLLMVVLLLGYFTMRFRKMAAALKCEIDLHAETEMQLIERNKELLQLASIDTLTGLVNRRVIMQQAHAEIRRANRYHKDLAVLMLDIDHFKLVNDQYGHACGDKVLTEFSRLIVQSIRDTDYAGRYGGEEFVVLLPEIDLKTAILSAERIRMAVAQHSFTLPDGLVLNITCSIGIATYQPEQDDLDKLLSRADKALYQAKHLGRNRCSVHE